VNNSVLNLEGKGIFWGVVHRKCLMSLIKVGRANNGFEMFIEYLGIFAWWSSKM
jgi:hypothetical protein